MISSISYSNKITRESSANTSEPKLEDNFFCAIKLKSFFPGFFVLISPNLRTFGRNIPFAVHWNPPEAK